MLIPAAGSRNGSWRRRRKGPNPRLFLLPHSLLSSPGSPCLQCGTTALKDPHFLLHVSLAAFFCQMLRASFYPYPAENLSFYGNSISFKKLKLALVQILVSGILFPNKIIQKKKGMKVSIHKHRHLQCEWENYK